MIAELMTHQLVETANGLPGGANRDDERVQTTEQGQELATASVLMASARTSLVNREPGTLLINAAGLLAGTLLQWQDATAPP